MDTLFKILASLFTLLFIISAALQYNDPDPIIWICIWGTAAMLSILFLLNKVSSVITLIAGILSLLGFLYVFPSNFQGFSLDAGEATSIEQGREAFGLLIIALVMLLYTFRIRQVSINKKKHF